jgi:hypothetical protein
MQLTRFDRWLREKFVYETHIHTLRPPESLPRGIRPVPIPDVPGKRYKYLFVASNAKAADVLLAQLKQQGQMYTTQVVDRKSWYVPFIAPKNKSLTWWIFSTLIIIVSVTSAALYVIELFEDPVLRKNFMDAVEIFKG